MTSKEQRASVVMQILAQETPAPYGTRDDRPTRIGNKRLSEEAGDSDDLALLAIVFGHSAAHLAETLEEPGGFAAIVRGAGPLTEGERVKLDAAVELGRRAFTRSVGQSLIGPSAVAEWAQARLGGLAHEELWCLCLDAQHRLIAAVGISRGGKVGTATTAADIVRHPVLVQASAFVLVHNHPSGNPEPSPQDIRMTGHAFRAGTALDIPLVDHVIIGSHGKYSSLFALGLLGDK